MVIRELSVLLNALCMSSRAAIIFSILDLLSGPPLLELIRTPAVMVHAVVLSVVPSEKASLLLKIW